METAGQYTKQVMEENDALKQLMELLNQQNMNEQSQDFMGVFWYVAGMQVQLAAMVDELQGVREQLSQMQEKQPKSVTENLMEKISHLQEKVTSLSERLTAVRNRLVETAAQAVSTFKEKGRAEMCKVLQKGISGVKSMLSGYRERLVDVMTDCEKTANQIDSIGDELKQIGNSVSNVGRLLAGKGTKEVSDEKSGVGLTRAVNTPVKKAVENLRKKIDGADQAFEKLDRLSARLDAGKEAEKGGRVSVRDKLSQMKEKAGQQKKAPEPDKVKSKEECL
ncbi:hypothetical protein IMSAGC002_00715 [Lachnospiraceae bacterium]|nr:hypothetical protein IMSAGC002_00715 [Lachnospiraceae bacterium]